MLLANYDWFLMTLVMSQLMRCFKRSPVSDSDCLDPYLGNDNHSGAGVGNVEVIKQSIN